MGHKIFLILCIMLRSDLVIISTYSDLIPETYLINWDDSY